MMNAIQIRQDATTVIANATSFSYTTSAALFHQAAKQGGRLRLSERGIFRKGLAEAVPDRLRSVWYRAARQTHPLRIIVRLSF